MHPKRILRYSDSVKVPNQSSLEERPSCCNCFRSCLTLFSTRNLLFILRPSPLPGNCVLSPFDIVVFQSKCPRNLGTNWRLFSETSFRSSFPSGLHISSQKGGSSKNNPSVEIDRDTRELVKNGDAVEEISKTMSSKEPVWGAVENDKIGEKPKGNLDRIR